MTSSGNEFANNDIHFSRAGMGTVNMYIEGEGNDKCDRTLQTNGDCGEGSYTGLYRNAKITKLLYRRKSGALAILPPVNKTTMRARSCSKCFATFS